MKSYTLVKTIVLSTLSLCALSARADIISSVGQAMPMVHINMDYNGFSSEFSVHVDSGVPQMTPLSILQPGDSFNPTAPWFDTLDPSEMGEAWTRRYGFVNTGDALPGGLHIWLDMDVTVSNVGAYFYRETPATFDPIFGTDGSSTLWEYPGAMTHPVFSTNASIDSFSVGGTAYIGDASGVPNPSFEAQPFTLNFTSVPEPGTYALLVGLLAVGFACFKRKQRS